MITLRAILALIAALLALAAPAATQTLNFGPPHLIEGGFDRPFGLAVDDTAGLLIVADTGQHRIKTVPLADLAGAYSFTEHGFVANRNDPAALTDPMGVASDGAGNLYVANTRVGEVQHYTFSGGSYGLATGFASTNPHTVDGTDIDLPRDVAVGPGGAVYLLDSGNNRILKAEGSTDTSWSVFYMGSDWANPYGLDVDSAGVVYVADTGNHRIVKIDGSTVTVIGGWGEGNGQFRYPRDVAVDQYDRLFVADTFNHRIQVLAADGHHLISLGHAPALGTINKVAVDAHDRLFAIDSDANHVIAFLGASVPTPFDPYFRDFVGDDGAEPSNDAYLISSPDILIRHAPDIDLAAAAATGLEAYAFQQPKYGETNYIYVALNNRGTQTATDNFVKLYWYDPSGAGQFPEDWSSDGLFKAWTSDTSNMPGNVLPVAEVQPGGRVVAGPLLWRPPAPESAIAGDGLFRLAARVNNPYDYPPQGASTTMARDSNNVTERPAAVLRGPFAEGVQNTLVVRVHFSDIAQQTDEASVIAEVSGLDAWVQEVSWGQASVEPVYRGPILPSEPSTHFDAANATLLVELAQDVLDKLVSAEPGVFNGGAPGDEITRVILVTNDLSATDGWALTSPWPYNLGGETRYLTVSVHGQGSTLPEYAKGMSRQFGMQDLFAHYNVTFPRPYADGWDNMARPHTGVHPLVWSKELAHWVSFSDANVLFVPRPDPGVTWNNGGDPLHLYLQASQTSEEPGPIAVAFGLTNGITSFVDETAFYYVEARSAADAEAPADSALPGTGVVMYYANRLIPTGQGPVILRDHVPGGDLTDAAIPVGGTETLTGDWLQVQVLAGTDGADYDLSVTYTPPITDYDVYMERGDPPWMSPDIWVDNQQDSYDEDEGRTPEDRGDLAIAGEENRVYARVRNQGPADAHDVEVAFFFSEPYHTVGGEGAFDEFRAVFLDTVPNGSDAKTYVEWTPQTGVNPHTCARVELRRLFNDTNPENDWAQRNLQIDHSVHGSPYSPVNFPFSFRNEEERAELIYYRVDGVPEDWSWSVNPEKAYVQPGALATGTLTLQPPPGAPDCTEHPVHVSGWAARDTTLVRLGGAMVRVGLRQKTAIDVKTRILECRGDDLEKLASERKKALARGEDFPGWDGKKQACLRTVAFGCTDPKQPNTEIVLRYEGPDGEPIYKTVKTDANGCYEDFNVVVEGGDTGVTAIYPGDDCRGPSSGETSVGIPLPEAEHPEDTLPDPDKRLCVSGLSFDAGGNIVEAGVVNDSNICKTGGVEQQIALKLAATGLFGEEMAGELILEDLGSLHAPNHGDAGFAAGRFTWKGDGFFAMGSATGLYGLGSSQLQVEKCHTCTEKPERPGHWELQLRGTIMEGKDAGAEIRLTLVLDERGRVLEGTAEGSLTRECGASKKSLRDRIQHEREAAAKFVSPLKECKGELGCFARISKAGEGKAWLDQTGLDQCREEGCGAKKRWQRVDFRLRGDAAREDAGPAAGNAELIVKDFVTILSPDRTDRGYHGGTFTLRTGSGALITGEMTGTTNGNAHRGAGRLGYNEAVVTGRYVGRLTGRVVKGEGAGSTIEARYQIQEVVREGRGTELRITLVGWSQPDCAGRKTRPAGPVISGGLRDKLIERLRGLRETTAPFSRVPDRLPGRAPENVTPDKPQDEASVEPQPSRPKLPREELPKGLYRPLEELPREAVRAYIAAEGGRLSEKAKLRLLSADSRFRALGGDRAPLVLRRFTALYAALPPGVEPGTRPETARAEFLLRRYDRDGDKRLSPKEFGKGWELYGELDGGDGFLDRVELGKVLALNIERAFAAADQNGDKQVDFREFALWWRGLP